MWRVSEVFFFQAEDGIRDVAVTGVQTCALPICPLAIPAQADGDHRLEQVLPGGVGVAARRTAEGAFALPGLRRAVGVPADRPGGVRSGERRVGKEGRSRWSPYH